MNESELGITENMGRPINRFALKGSNEISELINVLSMAEFMTTKRNELSRFEIKSKKHTTPRIKSSVAKIKKTILRDEVHSFHTVTLHITSKSGDVKLQRLQDNRTKKHEENENTNSIITPINVQSDNSSTNPYGEWCTFSPINEAFTDDDALNNAQLQNPPSIAKNLRTQFHNNVDHYQNGNDVKISNNTEVPNGNIQLEALDDIITSHYLRIMIKRTANKRFKYGDNASHRLYSIDNNGEMDKGVKTHEARKNPLEGKSRGRYIVVWSMLSFLNDVSQCDAASYDYCHDDSNFNSEYSQTEHYTPNFTTTDLSSTHSRDKSINTSQPVKSTIVTVFKSNTDQHTLVVRLSNTRNNMDSLRETYSSYIVDSRITIFHNGG